MKKIFIVGMARSGTTLVQQLLATHSKLVGANETAILKKVPKQMIVSDRIDMIARTEEEAVVVRTALNAKGVLQKRVSKVEFLDLYCSAFVSDAYEGYTEKSPVHSLFIGDILEEISDAHIVLVLRDPRAIITSRLNTKRISRGKRFGLPRSVQFLLNTTGALFGYRELNKYYSHDRVHTIRYEDLVISPERVLKNLFESLELPYEPVHAHINPTDMRLAYKNRRHTMNSSFDNEEVRTVQPKGAERWKAHITPKQDQLICSLFTRKHYPVLYIGKPYFESPKGNPIVKIVLRLLSYVDRTVFFMKNVR